MYLSHVLTVLTQLIHNIACLLESDKDLVSFRSVCHATHDAVEADGGSFWRRRFMQAFETPSFKLTGRRKEDAEKFRIEYQTRKSALHIVDPVFQTHGVKPKLKFDMGTTRVEKTALRILKDLISGKSLLLSSLFQLRRTATCC